MFRRLKEFFNYPIYKKKEQVLRRLYSKINKRKFKFIGNNTIIKKPLLIYNKKFITIGNNVTIREGARIEPINVWGKVKYNPQIIISDGVSIEQNCHINCGKKVEIGKNTVISAECMITDIDHEYENVNIGIMDQGLIVKSTKIGNNVFIGMGSKIMAGVSIGNHSIIGANAVVTRDIPEYSVAVGIPAKIIKRYNFESKQWEKYK